MKSFFFVSLGCPKNRVDTEVAAAALMEAGYVPCDSPDAADLLVVNTCSFIGDAREESVDVLLEMAGHKLARKGARLVAMGCLGQQSAEELQASMPEIDLILGTGAVGRLPDLLAGAPGTIDTNGSTFLPESTSPRVLTQSPAFAYLKVGDGCSRRCTFCTIPAIKGPFDSRPIPALVAEATALAAAGAKELVLVAQDVTQYGKPGRRRLLTLLDELEEVEGIHWIRLMYLYPEGISRTLLKRIGGGGKVVPYLDVPIQHIDNRILRRMKRGTSEKTVRNLIDDVRNLAPDTALRTTLITGFPGEDKDAFNKLRNFVKEVRFHHLGVFPFSPEPGTEAALLDQPVHGRTRTARVNRLLQLQKKISLKRNEALIGTTTKVLVEGVSDESDLVHYGRTAHQAPEVDGVVYLEMFEGNPGDFVDVEIVSAGDYDLVGRPS